MKTQINIAKLTIAAAAVFLSTFNPKNSMAQTAPAVKNIVIVHGAFADASGWEGVYRILKKDGYNVTLVQNPLTSLNDDVAATNRALEKQDGPAVLVVVYAPWHEGRPKEQGIGRFRGGRLLATQGEHAPMVSHSAVE